MTMDAPQAHTYGSACRLAAVIELKPDNTLLDDIPPIHAQFFYHSLIPIDDPLSTATVPASFETNNKASRAALRPFSHADNNALERAWLSLASETLRSSHQASLARKGLDPSVAAANLERIQGIVSVLARKHKEKHAHENQSKAILEVPSDALANTAVPVCCQELLIEASTLLRENFCEMTRRKQRNLDQTTVIELVMAAMTKDRPVSIAVPPRIAQSMSTTSPRTDVFVAAGLSVSLAWDWFVPQDIVCTPSRETLVPGDFPANSA